MEGSDLKIETPNGVITVKLSEDTTLREISEVSTDDLATGSLITVVGIRDDSGTMEARSITIIPEGVDFGGGHTRGQRGGAP